MSGSRKRSKMPSWSQCRMVIHKWPAAGLRELIHEMYKLDDANRQFLHARLSSPGTIDSREAFEKAKTSLIRMLLPAAVFNNRFRHADAKRLVDQYEKATADSALVAELLLADLTQSLATFQEVGDDERMVDHIYATMRRMDKFRSELSQESTASIQRSLEKLGEQYRFSFGYGVSDELIGMAEDWKA